jgi:hypothetical protein
MTIVRHASVKPTNSKFSTAPHRRPETHERLEEGIVPLTSGQGRLKGRDPQSPRLSVLFDSVSPSISCLVDGDLNGLSGLAERELQVFTNKRLGGCCGEWIYLLRSVSASCVLT